MAPKQDKQQLAKDLYLHTDKTQQEIADILDVHRRTVYLWIKNGRWQEMKIAARQAPAMIMQNIFNYIDQIDLKIRRRPVEEHCPTMEEVNMMGKLLRMTNLIDRQQTGAYMQAFEELMKFLNREDRELSKKVIKHADRYVQGFLDRGKFYLDDMEKENIDEVIKNLARQEEEQKTESESEPVEGAVTPGAAVIVACPDSSSGSPAEPPAEGPKCDKDVIMCDKDVIINSPADIRPKAAMVKPHEENDNTSISQNSPKEIFSENGILPPQPTPESVMLNSAELPVEVPNSQTANSQLPTANCQLTSAYYATLPPDQRPSPFREGDILWVNSPDDVNDDERKMGDKIRRYPDMEELDKFNRRVYETRIQMEAKDKEEKEKAAAIRNAEMDKLMNMDIYYGYRELLKFMTTDIYDKVNIKGTEVNKMWFQYNLSQMELPEERRLLLTEAEFLRQHSIDATLRYMRRTG